MPIHWNMNHVLQDGVKSFDSKAVYTEQALLTDTNVHFSFCPPQLLFSYNHTYNRSCSCIHKTPLALLGVIHSTYLYARKQSLHETSTNVHIDFWYLAMDMVVSALVTELHYQLEP